MEISDSDIKLIVHLIAEKLGPDAPGDKIRTLVAIVAQRLSEITPNESLEKAQSRNPIQKLIINAFGLKTVGLDENLRSYLSNKNLPLIAISIADIDKYKSLVALIDYSEYQGDINRLKFELSEICEKLGFKAIIQDSAYYGQ
jgi:predicted amino acid-binding ACT domain protein